ncbi:MAG: TlpA family protein disulfide reductase [Flavobacteriaceae bacterium]|jgi:thiol-disulfide isomerase/thioredoxin|nr:TlpA family protein disulfide reductase [Flavobacteriaceae bacterium]
MNIIKKRLRLPAFHYVVLSTAILAGCSNVEGKYNGNNEQQSDVVAERTENQIANDITFQDGNGKLIALNDLKGKVVFINFWATWCPPCIAEMPSINELKAKFGENENIIFLMVDVDGKHKKSQAFMDKREFNLPVYIPHSEIPKEFLSGAIPTTVILDKKGAIAARIEGGRDYSKPEIVNALKQLIEE